MALMAARADVDHGRERRSRGRYAGLLEFIDSYPDPMNLEFSGEIWFWKGPAPWYFITVPDEE